MTAILKVDTIQDTSGNNIINESSDTITIGASGDTTNIVGTLQNNGSAVASTNGITGADQFRLTTNTSGGTNAVISSNLERVDDATFAKIGTGMSQSSGVFTFPSTGLWEVAAFGMIRSNADTNAYVVIDASSNSGSNYDATVYAVGGSGASSNSTVTAVGKTLINVTNASTFRTRFQSESMGSNSYLMGNTDQNYTYFSFTRLGDSQ